MELAPRALFLTFSGFLQIISLTRENMWWLNWRDPPPPFISVCCRLFFLLHPSFRPPSMSSHLSLHVVLLILLSILIPLFCCFPLWSHHKNSSPFLSIHHLSLLHLNPLLLCLYISLPPTPLLSLSPSPQLCYFLLCMEDTFSLWSLGK